MFGALLVSGVFGFEFEQLARMLDKGARGETCHDKLYETDYSRCCDAREECFKDCWCMRAFDPYCSFCNDKCTYDNYCTEAAQAALAAKEEAAAAAAAAKEAARDYTTTENTKCGGQVLNGLSNGKPNPWKPGHMFFRRGDDYSNIKDCEGQCMEDPKCTGFTYHNWECQWRQGTLQMQSEDNYKCLAKKTANVVEPTTTEAAPEPEPEPANAECERPVSKWGTWCTHRGSTHSYKDCDGDGVPDHVCTDTSGNFGVVETSNGCKSTWPSGSCKARSIPEERFTFDTSWLIRPSEQRKVTKDSRFTFDTSWLIRPSEQRKVTKDSRFTYASLGHGRGEEDKDSRFLTGVVANALASLQGGHTGTAGGVVARGSTSCAGLTDKASGCAPPFCSSILAASCLKTCCEHGNILAQGFDEAHQ